MEPYNAPTWPMCCAFTLSVLAATIYSILKPKVRSWNILHDWKKRDWLSDRITKDILSVWIMSHVNHYYLAMQRLLFLRLPILKMKQNLFLLSLALPMRKVGQEVQPLRSNQIIFLPDMRACLSQKSQAQRCGLSNMILLLLFPISNL